MSEVKLVREFVTERLTAAAEEIFTVFEKTIVEYEAEIDRQRRLLEVVWKPQIRLHRLELPQQYVCKVEVLCDQEKNSSPDQEDPEPPQIKEEQGELCTSQEGEQLVVKPETDHAVMIPTCEDGDCQLLSHVSTLTESQDEKGSEHLNSGLTRNEKLKPKKEHDNCTRTEIVKQDTGRQRRDADVVWKPKIKLHRIELPQQYVCKVEVLTDQQLCDQERNSSLDPEDPEPPQFKEEQEELCTSQEGEQLVVKPETDHVMMISTNEESDQQLLSHSSPVAESQHQEGNKHVDSGSTRNVEPEPKKRRHKSTSHSNYVDISPMSETSCDTQTDKTSFKCDACSKGYRYRYQLNVHRRIHTGEKPYVCQRCRKRFMRTSELKKHIKIHKGQNQYLCRTCGKGFEEISKFKRHKKTHTGERPYSCDTCGKGFSQLSGLKAHVKVHTDERPHVCNTCGKKFRETSKLKKHIRIHTGEKPYVCSTCGKRFTEKSVLIRHERVHTGERPYPCDTCGKKFKQAAALSTHLRIHTGEKPHRCKACGKRFNRMTHLRSHMRIHTI